MADNAKLTRAADNIRVLAASMVEKAKSGHPGGAMGGADFINVLYTEFLRYDPDDLRYPFRDRLFLDPGHMSPMLYSTLALAGNYTMDDLKAFRQWGSCTPGHPEVDVLRGVENGKILVADPANYTRSQQAWDLAIILNEASGRAGAGGPFWIIG